MKYIFVTGGVVSGLGKGITAASLGRLLKARGLKVTLGKFDPYLNVDPGTMSPYQHGEVFVTDDGAETDLDIGHYERFIDVNLGRLSSTTAGQIYWSVLSRERNGDFLGGTVQVIPHITNEIKDRIYRMGKAGADIVIAEIGGTVGDIELMPFIEAIRQISLENGRDNVMYVHVSLTVVMNGELKSKPTQHSVKELLSIGIQPDVIVCRSEEELTPEIRAKIGLFCNIAPDCVIQNLSAKSIYEVPLLLHSEGLDDVVCRHLRLEAPPADLVEWENVVKGVLECDIPLRIGLVGKYVELKDAYLSVAEALCHAGIPAGAKVEIDWIHSEHVNDLTAFDLLSLCDGILVPGGFGERGIDGKIAAARYARENNIPFLGICMGMHMAVVEFARNVCGMGAAHSAEFDPDTPYPVADLMPEQKDITIKGGTMRLGLCPCKLIPGTVAKRIYGNTEIVYERHRHRYEISEQYRSVLESAGLRISGVSPDGRLSEIVEIEDHPFFIGVQFHPELPSRPSRPHPIFTEFVKCALKKRLVASQEINNFT